MTSKITQIHYDYADEHNYKAGEVIFFSGVFTPEQLAAMKAKFEDHEFFIPTQVGLEALQPRLTSFPSDADHVWHRIYLDEEDISVIDVLPEGKSVVCSTQEFFERFTAVTWDLLKEYERLGLDDIGDDDD
jgi:hypothetical protein